MVIIHLYDLINGFRYRKIGYDNYLKIADNKKIVGAWIIPGTI